MRTVLKRTAAGSDVEGGVGVRAPACGSALACTVSLALPLHRLGAHDSTGVRAGIDQRMRRHRDGQPPTRRARLAADENVASATAGYLDDGLRIGTATKTPVWT
jgi:hypothetical protein